MTSRTSPNAGNGCQATLLTANTFIISGGPFIRSSAMNSSLSRDFG
jgi:hypothetical protein